MDFSKGYAAAYRAVRIDPATWSEGEAVDGVADASVTRSGYGDTPLLEVGRLAVDTAAGAQLQRGYYRIKAYCTQENGLHVEDVATLLFEPVGGSSLKGRTTWDAIGYSVLKPAADAIMPRGSYCASGEDGAAWAAARLSDVLSAPVECAASFAMGVNYVFDLGETVLGAVWRILDAGSCVLRIEGDGTVRVVEKPSAASCDVVPQAVEVADELDLSAVPNRYWAVYGASVAVAENREQSSPTSLANRHAVDYVDESPAPVDGETLQAYAERRLLEMRRATAARRYVREYVPGATVFDMTQGAEPLRIMQQEIRFGRGMTVDERAERTVLA